MNIRPKHIVVLLVMLFTSTFLLDSYGMLSEADFTCYYMYQYVAEGFPSADEVSAMDNHAIVAFYFYLFLLASIIMFYFVKNKTVKIFPLGIIVFCAIALSVVRLFVSMEIENFYWENVFSPLVVGLTYITVFILWKLEFPEIRFKKSKIQKEYETAHHLK